MAAAVLLHLKRLIHRDRAGVYVPELHLRGLAHHPGDPADREPDHRSGQYRRAIGGHAAQFQPLTRRPAFQPPHYQERAMRFRAKLQMKMEIADQPGVVTLNFVPVEAGVPQLSLTVVPAAAAGLVVGKVYAFTAVEDQDPDPS